MLESVLQYLNNFFVIPGGIYEDEYSIQEGSITLPFLVDGQYFRIVGSVFNDGVYQYPISNLKDETFTGAIWALAIPSSLISIVDEIKAWDEKNGSAGPYNSESFGGYSYSRATNASGMAVGWQDIFAAKLSPWKKLKNSPAAKPVIRAFPSACCEANPWRC